MSTVQIALLWLSLSIGLTLAVDICEYQMNGVRLAHPADCNKFVECQNGKTNRISSCPLGLHFNRFKGVCDLRQRAACDMEFINFAKEETNCSACCAIYGCYVNPDCPETPGTTVSPVTDTPSSPTTSDTTITTASFNTPPSPETPSTPSTPTTPIASVTSDTPQTNQCPNNLTVCQGESNNSVMHVNGTCNQFITCLSGCAYILTCPGNLQYDIAKQKCDYPENVHCPWQTTPPIAGPSGVTCANHGQCAGQPDGKLFANPKSDGYIICQCECEVERPCPQGTKFSENQLTCAWKENVNDSKIGNTNDKENILSAVGFTTKNTFKIACKNDLEICQNQNQGIVFPVNGVCNKFYKCNFGCAVEILCPNTLIYNPIAEQCDYPENYKCPWPLTPLSGSQQENVA